MNTKPLVMEKIVKVTLTIELSTALRIATFLDQYAEDCVARADESGDKRGAFLRTRSNEVIVHRTTLLAAVAMQTDEH